MVEQVMDPKLNEKGLGTADTELSTGNKQVPIDVKKTPLRDLQNDNRITKPNPIRNSPFSKDRGPVIDAVKVSGVKRPSAECPRSPSHHQSPSSTAANGHLVYVRRKPESELCKSSTCNATGVTADCTQLKQPDQQDETTQSISQSNVQKGSCSPAISPFPMPSSVGTSEKPSVPLSLGMPGMSSGPGPSESNHPPTSTTPLVGNSKRIKNVNWEERFQQLQILLRKLDQSDHEDYLQMLRSLSSVELSRHAVELEKRSIQLSLEEAKEMQRVAALNVMGKSPRSLKADQNHSDK